MRDRWIYREERRPEGINEKRNRNGGAKGQNKRHGGNVGKNRRREAKGQRKAVTLKQTERSGRETQG